MRENHLGTAISVLIHSCIMLPLVAASFTAQNRPISVVEIDFSLTKGPSSGGGPPKVKKEIIEKKSWALKRENTSGRIAAPDRPVNRQPETVLVKEQVELHPIPTIVTASDTHGEMLVHGTPATYKGSSGSEGSLLAYGGSAGGIDGTESGGSGTGKGTKIILEEGNDYSYIREAVMKNIGYPERARRMGFEGKTLLSFIVLENGTTSQIKIVKSSGYQLLDDSAKEGVARTLISKKVPFRVVVRLPITFRLQVSKNDRV